MCHRNNMKGSMDKHRCAKDSAGYMARGTRCQTMEVLGGLRRDFRFCHWKLIAGDKTALKESLGQTRGLGR